MQIAYTLVGGSGAFSTATDTASLVINAVNNAPVLAPHSPTHNTTEDGAPFTASVSAIIASSVSDADAGASQGIAITGVTGSGNVLRYSLDGGTTWQHFSSPSESDALLLRSTDLMQFTPATDNGGTLSVQYRAWDQTSGTAGSTADTTSNGGSTAFSTASDQIVVNTAAVNDAPIAVNDHHGLSFDGIDDFVNLGNDASFAFSNTMTMEVWARPTAYPVLSNVILNKEGEYEIGISDTGSLMWAFANTDPSWSWHDTGYVLSLNQWAHISVSYDNGTVNTYVNGHNVETYYGAGDIGDAHATLDDLRVGGRQNSPTGNYFTGEIDEVRIWSTVRTQAEIQNNLDAALTGSEAGLAGYWNFNEGSGTVASDLTSNANHGVLTDEAGTGAPVWTGLATDQDTPLNIAASLGVLKNDIDVDGDTLTVSQVQGSAAHVGTPIVIGSGALVTVNADGSFDYDPNGAFDHLAAGETGIDTFTYTVSDGNGGSDTATVSITISGSDDAPTIVANSDLDNSGNQVIDFQGGDDTITLTGLPVNTEAGTDVTVEFWMNWDGTDNVLPFGFGAYDLWFSGGNFGFNTANSDLYGTSNAGLATGWHHVAAVFRNGDAAGSRLIIDGVERTLTQISGTPNNTNAYATSAAQISGWGYNGSYKFAGQIDQVRIWNGGRSETAVRADMFSELSGPQTGLVAAYSFTGATTGAGGVIDDSGNGHHGTMGGMTAANVITGSNFERLGDQIVNEDDVVTLQVSAFDPENSALTYAWTQTSGPAVTLSDANAEKPTFIAPNQAGNYQAVFTVDVSDGTNTTTETVTISVNAINTAPFFGANGDGTAITPIPGSLFSLGFSSTLQSDGKSIVVGSAYFSDSDFTLARFDTNGTLDLSFGGGDGIVTLDLGGNETANGVVVQADGKIVILGTTDIGVDSDLVVARFNADGTLDTSFDGDGYAITNVSGYDSAAALAIQSDGRIVVAGTNAGGGNNFSVLRYNTDGSLDTSFDTDGIVDIDFGASSSDTAGAISIQNDGKIVVGGQSNNQFALVRLTTTGLLDTSFHFDGLVTTDFGIGDENISGMVLQSDGKIVAGGSANSDFALARYHSDGSLDTSFDSDGLQTSDLGATEHGYDVALTSTEQILIVGITDLLGSNDVVIQRYNSDGSLDTGFDSDGTLITVDNGGNEYGYSIDVAANGSMHVGGNVQSTGFLLNKYHKNGTLDTDFAPSTNLLDANPTFVENGSPVVLDADVQLFDKELSDADDFSGATLTLGRSGGADNEDQLAFDGTNVSVSGNSVLVGGVPVGTYTFIAGELTVRFGSGATQARVNTLMQNIVYSNSSDNPAASVEIGWTFNDGNSGAQGSGDSLEAFGRIIVDMTAVNDVPTLTALAAVVETTNEDTEVEISFADLAAQGDEADVDGSVDAFVIKNIATGTLRIGTSAGTATAWAAGSNDTIDATHHAYWTPTADATGTLNAFSVVAKDNSGAESTTPVIAQVSVTAVNDAPVVDAPLGVLAATEQVGLAIHGTGFTVTDVDADSGTMTATINVGEGAITVAAGDSGVSISGGNGTETVTFTGTLSQLDDLLTGNSTGTITYLGCSAVLRTAYSPQLAMAGTHWRAGPGR